MESAISTRLIGMSLLTQFALPFELLAVLLLVCAPRRELLREAGGVAMGLSCLPDARRRGVLRSASSA